MAESADAYCHARAAHLCHAHASVGLTVAVVGIVILADGLREARRARSVAPGPS